MNRQLLEYGTCRSGRRDVVIVSATLAVCHWQATARRSTDQSLIDLQTNYFSLQSKRRRRYGIEDSKHEYSLYDCATKDYYR